MNFFVIFIKSILEIFISCIKGLWFISIPLILGFIFFIVVLIGEYIRLRYIEHIKPKFKDYEVRRFPGTLINIFYIFPKAMARDIIRQDYTDFDKFGIHMVVGQQGAGKSITAVYLMKKWKAMYPKLKIYTNMGYEDEDDVLVHWKQLIERKNGTKGVVNLIDDFVSWWSSKNQKDVPPEVFSEICQQRKQRKALVGTIQSFGDLPKMFRKQTHHVWLPKTINGNLTIVYHAKAKDYDMETDRFKKMKLAFVFAHTDEIRDSYDTTKKIERLKDEEFYYNQYLNCPEGSPRVGNSGNSSDE